VKFSRKYQLFTPRNCYFLQIFYSETYFQINDACCVNSNPEAFVYVNDNAETVSAVSMQPRKYYWHRKKIRTNLKSYSWNFQLFQLFSCCCTVFLKLVRKAFRPWDWDLDGVKWWKKPCGCKSGFKGIVSRKFAI
jgi:hypothetical protein